MSRNPGGWEFAHSPACDLLEPWPLSNVASVLKIAGGFLLLGLFLAYLGNARNVHAARRPAKYAWLSGTLWLVFAGAVGLPRYAKFVILVTVSAVVVPVAFIASCLFVFGACNEDPRPEEDAGGRGEAVVEEEVELLDKRSPV